MVMQGFSYAYAGPVLLKDIDGRKGIVQFYGGAFNNVDSDGDVTVPGAFTKTFKENGPTGANRIKHLRQHERRTMIGRVDELAQDSIGALVTSQLAIENTDGKDALALYELDLFEHSFGYQIIKSHKDQDGIQYLTELAVSEFSAVTWGANPNTPLIGMKCDSAKGIELSLSRIAEREQKLTKALRHGNISDTLGHQLADELDALQSAYKGLISLSGELLKPAPATSAAAEPSGEKALSQFLKLVTS
jgi:HK97 family phage prohead protease